MSSCHVHRVCAINGSISAAATPWKPVINLWKTQWPVLEFVVDKSQGQTIGMKNRKVRYHALLTFLVCEFHFCRRYMKMKKKVVY